ncbi:MAG: hypothetical protein ABGY24_10395 [bacterium]
MGVTGGERPVAEAVVAEEGAEGDRAGKGKKPGDNEPRDDHRVEKMPASPGQNARTVGGQTPSPAQETRLWHRIRESTGQKNRR